MFKKIAVAYDQSSEAEHALVSAILLAKSLGTELNVITVEAALPAYTAFAAAGDPSLPQVLKSDQDSRYNVLGERARASARLHGVELHFHLIEGREVKAIIIFLRKHEADLLVIGLHQKNTYLSRLWSTVYELAQEAPCSVLGIH